MASKVPNYDGSKRAYGWAFTHNNYTNESIEAIKNLDCKYLVFGREVAPSTGTPHIQGYINFVCQKSWSKCRKLFSGLIQAHIFPAIGSHEQNFRYCTKEDPAFFEKGTKPMNQKEKGKAGADKIKAMWDLAKKGEFEKLPLSMIRTAEYVHAKYGPKPVDRAELDNKWIWGESGVGKSKYVRDTHSVFYSKPMSKWWDGYNGEDVVVLDDFAPEHTQYLQYYLKIWTDHYVFNAEVKGGMLRARPKTFIVTSQYSPETCFPEPETLQAIRRRFTVVNLVGSEAERVARVPRGVWVRGFTPVGGFGVVSSSEEPEVDIN